MKNVLLTTEEVLDGYQSIAQLYPYIPSLIIWRGWEYAAYKKCALVEPVLDVGCGDGNFFRLVWPGLHDVVGVDMNQAVAAAAKKSGVYRDVHVMSADKLSFSAESFAAAFANCSLEHMDNLPDVLRGIHRCLRPGGFFAMSVVTDKFVDWDVLSLLMKILGESDRAASLKAKYTAYHNLVNPLSSESWINHLEDAGFSVETHIPIVPELTGRLFLFVDHLWHIPHEKADIGNLLSSMFSGWPNFNTGHEEVLKGLLQMENDRQTCCGAVFCARKIGGGKF